jgi:hypothetical protein
MLVVACSLVALRNKQQAGRRPAVVKLPVADVKQSG